MMQAVADEVGADLEDDGEGYFSLEYPFEDGRTQLVTAYASDDEEGNGRVMVYSTIGPAQRMNLMGLLERNFSIGYTHIAVDEGDALVCASMPLEDLSAEDLGYIIDQVSGWADSLESEFVGGDTN
jgi:hypothetical protein